MTENTNQVIVTPKRSRNTYPNLPNLPNDSSNDISRDKRFNDRLSLSNLENKKSRISYADDSYFIGSSPNPNMVTSTPVNRNRHSTSNCMKRYNINSETGDLLLDATSYIQDLNNNISKKIEILENINNIVNFQNSCICINHLDPDSSSPVEKYIKDYPKLFETNVMYSKYINKILISSTKLSEIYLCQHRFNSQYYVVKSGYKSNSHCLSESSREIINEVKILTLIGKHSHVVDFYDAWIEDERFHLQLGFISGGSLIDFIVGNSNRFCAICDISKLEKRYRISSCSAYIMLAHISSVLVYMHEVLNIFHGDIKPSNVLVDMVRYTSNDLSMAKLECHSALLDSNPNPRLRFKLCDFGRSGATSNVIKMDEGDGRYLPTLNDNSSNYHLFASSRDIYALGLTIFDCFGGIINQESASAIRKGNWEKWPRTISENWQRLIKKMSHKDEMTRYTAREILELDNVKCFIQPEALSYFKFEEISSDIMEIN